MEGDRVRRPRDLARPGAVKEIAHDLGSDAEIQLTTAFRPGVRLARPGTTTRVSLPFFVVLNYFDAHGKQPGQLQI